MFLILMISIIINDNIIILNRDDLIPVKYLYNVFMEDAYVYKSWYPRAFLNTLTFENNIYKSSYNHLQYLFMKYCYDQSKQQAINYYGKIKTYLMKKFKKSQNIPIEEEVINDKKEDLSFKPNESQTKPFLFIDKQKEIQSIENNFKIRKTQQLPFSELSKDKIIKLSNITYDKCILMICFINKDTNRYGIAYFEKNEYHDTRSYLDILNSIGIINIEFKLVSQFSVHDLTYSLCDHYFYNNLPDMSIALQNIYRIYKFLNGKENSVILKSILEFIHSNYEFSYKKDIDIYDLYDDYCDNNSKKLRFPLNAFVDIYKFYNMLKFMYYEIIDNKVLNIRKRSKKIQINLEFDGKLNSMMQIPYVHQKTHQLRSEPVCIGSKNSWLWQATLPWNESSHVVYSQNNILKKSFYENIVF